MRTLDESEAQPFVVNALVHRGDPIAELDGIREIITHRVDQKARLLSRLVKQAGGRSPRRWPDTHPHMLWEEWVSDIWHCIECGRAWTSEQLVRDQLDGPLWRKYRALIAYGTGLSVTNPSTTHLLKGITEV